MTRAEAVLKLMADSKWRTLAQIAKATSFPEASVSAQLREFRKPSIGFKVSKRMIQYRPHIIYEYRLTV